MAIKYVKRLAGPYIGVGQTTFTFSFLIYEASDVYVGTAMSEADRTSILEINTDYTVTMNADQQATPGGTVTLKTPLVEGQIVVIGSDLDYEQFLQLTNYSRFPPELVNKALDRLCIQIQQIVEKIGRTLSVPATSSETPESMIERLLKEQNEVKQYAVQAQVSADSAASSVIEVKKYADATLTISPYVKYLKPIADDIGSIVTIAPHLEDIKQVSQIATEVEIVGGMGTSVITLSQNIPVLDEVAKHSQAIQVLAADFKGQEACPNIHDFGVFGVDDIPSWTPTGGAISGVAENIEDVKTTADLKEKIEFIINNWDDIESAIAIMQGNVLLKQNNLSDLLSVATARTNLGLGTMATANLDLGEWDGN